MRKETIYAVFRTESVEVVLRCLFIVLQRYQIKSAYQLASPGLACLLATHCTSRFLQCTCSSIFWLWVIGSDGLRSEILLFPFFFNQVLSCIFTEQQEVWIFNLTSVGKGSQEWIFFKLHPVLVLISKIPKKVDSLTFTTPFISDYSRTR